MPKIEPKTVNSPKKTPTSTNTTITKKSGEKTPIVSTNSKSAGSITPGSAVKRIETTTSSQNSRSKTNVTASPNTTERTLVTPLKGKTLNDLNVKQPATPLSSQSSVDSPSSIQHDVPVIDQFPLDTPSATLDDSSVISTINNHITSVSVPDSDLIKVCVKIRPILRVEEEHSTFNGDVNDGNAWIWGGNTIHNPLNKDINYNFDYLFTPENNNTDVYESVVKNVVDSAMHGYHGSVFSYGQTNSGKTFTMNGGPTQPGIIPQAIYHCFNAVNSFPDREFLLRVSYLEVYNEQIKDLLGMEPLPIKIQHDPKLGTVLSGVKEQVVLNPQQVIALIRSGEAHRHVGSTDMNEKSSRAHTLFKLIIESKERTKPGSNNAHSSPVKVSTLNLVDLAGSESAKMTNSKGERLREAKHINQSLLTLSTIIQRLSEVSKNPTHKQHLPYRDSKLTRLLESALDGNAHISIICTISPALKCVDESTNTLKFASRAKLIKMSAKLNETVDDKTLLRAYREEIEQLKAKLQQFESVSSSAVNSSKSPSSLHRRSDSTASMNDNDNDSVMSGDGNMPMSNAAAERMEEEQVMLQMIAEMERLILKADLTKTDASSGAMAGSRPNTNTSSTLKRSGDSRGAVNTFQKLKTATTFSDLTDPTIDAQSAEKEKKRRSRGKRRSKTNLETLVAANTQSPDSSAKRLNVSTVPNKDTLLTDYMLGSPRLIPLNNNNAASKKHGHPVSLLTSSYDGPPGAGETNKGVNKANFSPPPPVNTARKTAATAQFSSSVNDDKAKASPTDKRRGNLLTSAKSMSVMPRSNHSLLSVSKIVPHTVASVLAASGSASLDGLDGSDNAKTPVKHLPPALSSAEFLSPQSNSSASSDTYGKGTWKDVPTPAANDQGVRDAFLTADSSSSAPITPILVKQAKHAALTPTIEINSGDDDEGGVVVPTPPVTPKSPSKFVKRDSFIGSRVDMFENLATPKADSLSPSKTPRSSGGGGSRLKKASFDVIPTPDSPFSAKLSPKNSKLTMTTPNTQSKAIPLDLPRSAMKRSQTMPMHTMLSLSQQADWDLVDAVSPLSTVATSVQKLETSITNSEKRRESLNIQTSSMNRLAVAPEDGPSTPFSTLASSSLTTSPHTPLLQLNPKSAGDFFDINSSDVTLVDSGGEDEDDEDEDYDDDEDEEYSESPPSRPLSSSSLHLDDEVETPPQGGAGDESVLYGVTKMLSFLKGYIAKGNNVKPSVARGGTSSPCDFSTIYNGGSAGADYIPSNQRRVTTGGIDVEQHDSTVSVSTPPSSILHTNGIANTIGSGISGASLLSNTSNNNNNSSGLNSVSKAQYERLKLDFKLKEADNRFLQEELENKDRMLGMLTEGLKEVEISQTQWLTTNQELSYELDRALQQNKALKIEMARLKEQMMTTTTVSDGTPSDAIQTEY